jgi:uncharacterized protein
MMIVPDESEPIEFNVHIDKAIEKLSSATMLLEKNFIDDAVSRAYYAVFHAIVAALREKNIKLDQHKHAFILNQFRSNFIDTKLFSKETFFKIQQIKMVREQADYSTKSKIDKKKAEQLLADAESIVNLIKDFLNENPE